MKKMNRYIVSVSLPDDAFNRLEDISKSTGLSKSAVMSLLLTNADVVVGVDKINSNCGSIAEGPAVTA